MVVFLSALQPGREFLFNRIAFREHKGASQFPSFNSCEAIFLSCNKKSDLVIQDLGLKTAGTADH